METRADAILDPSMETNARALDRPLTDAQIVALAELEVAFTNGRGRHVDVDAAENVLHAFICVA